jgi:hypothetical protein
MRTGLLYGQRDQDDGIAGINEMSLGNGRCKWIVFDACNVLQKIDGSSAWFNALTSVFAGLHYMLGFHTTCADSAGRGRIFAERLLDGSPIREAWIRACIETEGKRTKCAWLRAYNASVDSFNDCWGVDVPTLPRIESTCAIDFVYHNEHC